MSMPTASARRWAPSSARLGVGTRWPSIGELAAHPRASLLLVLWAAYRLYPYAPTASTPAWWYQLHALLLHPSLPPDEWRTLHHHLATRCRPAGPALRLRRWALLFPLLAVAEILARIVMTGAGMKLADIAGAATAVVIWPMLRWLPGCFSILSVALAALVVTLRLAPFDFQPPGRDFGWVPFNGAMHGSIGVAIQALLRSPICTAA